MSLFVPAPIASTGLALIELAHAEGKKLITHVANCKECGMGAKDPVIMCPEARVMNVMYRTAAEVAKPYALLAVARGSGEMGNS